MNQHLLRKKCAISKFKLDSVVYTTYRTPAVLRMSPYIPVNDKDESSCYSLLLLHVPWPAEGEVNLQRTSSLYPDTFL